MPFPPNTQVREFTREKVLELDEGLHGVYALCAGTRWVYVGKGAIRERLLAHLGGDNPCIDTNDPTHWVDYVTDNADRKLRELILELDPVCNRQTV